MTSIPPAYRSTPCLGWRDGEACAGQRDVPEETAIAFSYNRLGYAVMMGTPADLDDFAVGFSLSEQIVRSAAEIQDLAILPVASGIELRMWLGEERMAALTARRRRIAGPTGCGLCGLDSLKEAVRPSPRVAGQTSFVGPELSRAMVSLGEAQELNSKTRAVHAAAFWLPATGLVAAREDVGRHNALDKLAGGLAREGITAKGGAILLTSRVSVELVQKTAVLGATVLVAASVPTALALRAADTAGITVVGIARTDGFEVFTHPNRIDLGAELHRPPTPSASDERARSPGTLGGPVR
jgi:FdhD protein